MGLIFGYSRAHTYQKSKQVVPSPQYLNYKLFFIKNFRKIGSYYEKNDKVKIENDKHFFTIKSFLKALPFRYFL